MSGELHAEFGKGRNETTEQIEERIGKALGHTVIEEARRLADGDPNLYRALLRTSACVQAFAHPESTEGPKLYDCPDCLDSGWVPWEHTGKSGAWTCQWCDLGLTVEARLWLDETRPLKGTGEKRVPSVTGQAAFARHFRRYASTDREHQVRRKMQEMTEKRKGNQDAEEPWE